MGTSVPTPAATDSRKSVTGTVVCDLDIRFI